MSPPIHVSGLRVRLINLPRSHLRRQQMQDRLSALGLAYEISPAVDGVAEQERLLQTVDVPAFQRHVGRDVLPGEIGCYHSHIGAWRSFLESGDSVLLVLEDDVVFGPDFLSAVQEAMRVQASWDFLKLNKIRAQQGICQGLVGPYRLNAYLGTATGLGAYMIRRETAQRLLPAMLPITRPIDHELDRIHVHDFRHFGLEPFPSYVRDDNMSTITGKSFDAVRKYRWFKRLPSYFLRLANLWGHFSYLIRTGRILPRRSPL